jgi:hypothetical protein
MLQCQSFPKFLFSVPQAQLPVSGKPKSLACQWSSGLEITEAKKSLQIKKLGVMEKHSTEHSWKY